MKQEYNLRRYDRVSHFLPFIFSTDSDSDIDFNLSGYESFQKLGRILILEIWLKEYSNFIIQMISWIGYEIVNDSIRYIYIICVWNIYLLFNVTHKASKYFIKRNDSFSKKKKYSAKHKVSSSIEISNKIIPSGAIHHLLSLSRKYLTHLNSQNVLRPLE